MEQKAPYITKAPNNLKKGQWSDSALKILKERYLHRRPDGMQETPEDMIWRVANAVAQADREYGADDTQVLETARSFYGLMISHQFLPNSPTLMNAGLDNGMQLSACYVLPAEDSIEGVFDSVKNAALIHKTGGGTGFPFSRIRPRGSRVNTTGGVASGPVSFMRVFDAATEAIKQGGRRRGANMGILRVDHPDIEEFITCKLDGGITNFNISVAITRDFMLALRDDIDYDLIAQSGWPATDGSRYEGGEVIGQKNARGIFDKLVDAAWASGDPGMVFIDLINDSPANPTPEIGLIEATNPCVTGDTMVYTDQGLRTAEDLFDTGKPVDILVDGRMSDQNFQLASRVIYTGERTVHELLTKEGYKLKLTEDHKVMTNRGWVETRNLVDDDKIHICNRKGGFGLSGDINTGLILGWSVGDGAFTQHRITLDFYEKKQVLAPMFLDSVKEVLGKDGANVKISDLEQRDMKMIRSIKLTRFVQSCGLSWEKHHLVPLSVFSGTEDMQRGFLQALFTADGCVVGTPEKGLSVRLSQSDMGLLEQVQKLLLNFGIACKIYRNRRGAGYRKLPDSNRNLKLYWCKAQHEIVIPKTNLIRFRDEIGFLIEYKNEKLADGLTAMNKRGPYKESFTARFESLTDVGIENVYDLTEPIKKSFIANGIVVHNCGEQPLLPNEACNLGSINLMKFIDPETDFFSFEALGKAVRTAVHFLDNVITINPYPLPEIDQVVKDNRRIGLGVMGLADLLFDLGIAYNSDEGLGLAGDVMCHIDLIGHKKSVELAKKRGSFPNWDHSIYKDTGPIRNSTVTTIAPTGSISIIAGVSSGIEPVFALAFQHVVKQPEGGERVLTFTNPAFERVAKARGFWNDELRDKILARGSVRGLQEVPEDIQNVFVTAHEIEPHWHVEMQAAFQKHTDNGVSKTINLPNTATREDIEDAYLLAYKTDCLGITVFRDGCKDTQVLNVGVQGAKEGVEIPETMVDDEMITINMSHAPKTPKVRPVKLSGKTYRKRTPVGTAYITVNTNGGEDKEPFEVFINVGKAGSDVAADAEGLGRLISLILRMAGPSIAFERTQDVVAQLRGIGSGRAQGFGSNRVMSLADAVAQALAEHVGLNATGDLPGLPDVDVVTPTWKISGVVENLNITNGTIQIWLNGFDHFETVPIVDHMPEWMLKPDTAFRTTIPRSCAENRNLVGIVWGDFLPQEFAQFSNEELYSMIAKDLSPKTGDLCPECGQAMLVPEEGCKKCYGCGYSEC